MSGVRRADVETRVYPCGRCGTSTEHRIYYTTGGGRNPQCAECARRRAREQYARNPRRASRQGPPKPRDVKPSEFDVRPGEEPCPSCFVIHKGECL